MVDVKISYETLFDILRREKQREELQELPKSFVKDVSAYLSDKEAILRKHVEVNDPFSGREQENARIQLKNVRKILKELFERRENKTIRLAQDKVRQGPSLSLPLLDEEKAFYQELIKTLTDQRARLLQPLLLSQPIVRVPERPEPSIRLEKPPSSLADPHKASADMTHGPSHETIPGKGTDQAKAPQKPSSTETDMKQPSHPAQQGGPERPDSHFSSEKRVRILNPLPRFVGPELEIYGPYAESSITSLPLPIADLLIRKGRAEEVTE